MVWRCRPQRCYLKLLYEEYQDRLSEAASIELADCNSPDLIEMDLNTALKNLSNDLTFLHTGK